MPITIFSMLVAQKYKIVPQRIWVSNGVSVASESLPMSVRTAAIFMGSPITVTTTNSAGFSLPRNAGTAFTATGTARASTRPNRKEWFSTVVIERTNRAITVNITTRSSFLFKFTSSPSPKCSTHSKDIYMAKPIVALREGSRKRLSKPLSCPFSTISAAFSYT